MNQIWPRTQTRTRTCNRTRNRTDSNPNHHPRDSLAELFEAENRKVYCIPEPSALEVGLQSGFTALKTPLCSDKVSRDVLYACSPGPTLRVAVVSTGRKWYHIFEAGSPNFRICEAGSPNLISCKSTRRYEIQSSNVVSVRISTCPTDGFLRR